MKDGGEQATAFDARDSRRALCPMRAGSEQRPDPNDPGVPRGRTNDHGDGGGARDLSHDGTRPIGGKRKHA